MADSDKNILITPNIGSTTADPNIVFTGGDNNPVTLTVLDDGTLSFSGSAGQLFSINDSLTGTIFSVNDVSGIPSIEVDDDGTVRLAEFSGNVLIGTATDAGEKLQVEGTGNFTGRVDFASGITAQTLDVGVTGDRTIQALSSDQAFGSYGDLHLNHYGGNVYMVGDDFSFNTSGVGQTNGSWRAPVFYDSNNTAYYMDPASTSVVNAVKFFGDFYHDTSNRDNGMYGSYDSTKTDHIWSMGTAYRNSSTGANFGNLYGLAYKHTNNSTGGTMASGHQMVWCQNGSPNSAVGTNIWTSGTIIESSDSRLKTNVEKIDNAIEKVQKLNGYTFDKIGHDKRLTGVIAQEVLDVLPEAVNGEGTGVDDDYYSVSYGNMVGLLIEAIKEQQNTIDELKARIEALETK